MTGFEVWSAVKKSVAENTVVQALAIASIAVLVTVISLSSLYTLTGDSSVIVVEHVAVASGLTMFFMAVMIIAIAFGREESEEGREGREEQEVCD